MFFRNGDTGMLKNIISFISVFMFLVSLINILLSLFVYYALHDFCYEFVLIRWPVSAGIVFFLLWNKTLKINNIKLHRH